MIEEYLKDLFGLDGQTAVVIGGAGVLGGALCRGLAAAGAHVIVADLTEQGCQSRVADLKQISEQASYALVDVTSRKSIEDLLATAVQRAGRVQILVNCAGVNAANDFLEATDADWDRIMVINLRAVFQA
jgi:NAD(P)-dependent dehydrogenase (short-subunit alcohol dehydrogenase family)